MKTTIYVDGYNLYYGLLKHTSFKWLDLSTFFHNIIHPIEPQSVFSKIKYFTAPVLVNAGSPDAQQCQQTYWHALQGHCNGLVEIIHGKYFLESGKVRLVDGEKKFRECEERLAWKLEEKRTDVNIALHAYHDALSTDLKQIVLCSNDSDQVPTLEFIRRHCPHIKIGLILPRRESFRQASKDLIKLVDWHRASLREEELESSQLPRVVEVVTGTRRVNGQDKPRRKVYHRPDGW